MKKISSILISLFLILNISVAEINIPQPTDNFFVNDFANVIEAEDEQVIFDIARELYESSGNSTQVVVVTIDSLDGNSIEEYANELFNTWGIGSKEKNDGVLVLLAVNDRRSRIEVGYGLEGLLPDGKTGTIQDDYMIPFYSENNFSEGIRSGTQAIIDVIKGDLVIEENVVDERIDTIFNISATALVLGLIGWSWYASEIRKCRKCGGRKFKRWREDRGRLGYVRKSECLTCGKVYSVAHHYSTGGSSGSGFSGGGRSGGGFSGGGGRSGGGGSSRSF